LREKEYGIWQSWTWAQVADSVRALACGLMALGIKRGDRVAIYLPLIPELAIAMLACARIGAVHSVVFGGFAAKELATRIDDAAPKAVLTASCGIEPGRLVRVGIDRTTQAALGRLSPKPPIHIETPRAGVKLNHHVVGDRRIDHLGRIHAIALAPQQQTSSKMPQHGRRRMLDRPDDTTRHRGLILRELAMHRHDHVIELVEHRIVEIEFALSEDIALDAGKYPRGETTRRIEFPDLGHLPQQPLLSQTARLETGFRMVSNPEVFPP